jgi:midasin
MDAVVRRKDGLLTLASEILSRDLPLCSAPERDNERLWTLFQGNQKLEELHVAVEGSRAVCVLVRGPSGCGKTSLLREYASLCGRSLGDAFVTVHLGEQIDSKVLLGTFTCTSVPGEFVWTPGLLTRCVLGGQWMVMEDIDSAPPDVVSLLLPLLTSRRLNLPGYYKPVVAAPGFKLFLTKR